MNHPLLGGELRPWWKIVVAMGPVVRHKMAIRHKAGIGRVAIILGRLQGLADLHSLGLLVFRAGRQHLEIIGQRQFIESVQIHPLRELHIIYCLLIALYG